MVRETVCEPCSSFPIWDDWSLDRLCDDVPRLSRQELMEEYEELREEHYAGQEERHYLTFDKAREKGLKIDFRGRPPAPAPRQLGVTVVKGKYELSDVLEYIDWNPFFQVRTRLLAHTCNCTLHIVHIRVHVRTRLYSILVLAAFLSLRRWRGQEALFPPSCLATVV